MKVGVATITDLTISGFATATTFNGQLDSGIGTITKAFIGAGVTIDQKNIDAGQTGIITALTFDGNLTGTPTLGTGVTVTAQGLEVAAGIVTAATFTGNITATTATITTANATKVVVGSAATVDQGNLDVSGITSIRSDCNVFKASE